MAATLAPAVMVTRRAWGVKEMPICRPVTIEHVALDRPAVLDAASQPLNPQAHSRTERAVRWRQACNILVIIYRAFFPSPTDIRTARRLALCLAYVICHHRASCAERFRAAFRRVASGLVFHLRVELAAKQDDHR